MLSVGVLQQRCAGLCYCYEAWSKWHKQTVDELTVEIDRLCRPKGQAKGGKGVKDREQQDSKTKERVDQVGCCVCVAGALWGALGHSLLRWPQAAAGPACRQT